MFIDRYFTEKSNEKNAVFAFVLFLCLIALLIFAWAKRDIIGLSACVLGLALIVKYLWLPETIPALYFAYLALLPIRYTGEDFDIFPFYYSSNSIPIAIAAMGTILLLARLKPYGRLPENRNLPDKLSTIIILLIVWYIFLIFKGLALGNNGLFIFRDSCFVSIFITYFFWRYLFRLKGNINSWLLYILFLSFCVAYLYFYLVSISFTDIVTFVLVRAVTRHGQITIVAIPLIMSYFFIYKRPWQRTIALITMASLLVQVFFTQQRLLWVLLVADVFIFFTLYIHRDGFSTKNFLRWLFTILTALLIIILLILGASIMLEIDLGSLLARWDLGSTITSDSSLRMRVFDGRRAWSLSEDVWLWGNGSGATFRSVPRGTLSQFFDQSYILPFFTGGLPFVILLTLVYIVGVYRSLWLLLNSKSETVRMLSIAFISIFSSLLLAGIIDTTLVFYRHVFIWMMILAATSVLKENEKYLYRVNTSGNLDE
jgi:hypothetical protein